MVLYVSAICPVLYKLKRPKVLKKNWNKIANPNAIQAIYFQ